MDFELTDDQVALQEGIAGFCAGRFSIGQVREMIDTRGFDRERWGELAEMGVFSLCLDESDGGLGLGLADAVIAFEGLGRAIVPGPLVWTHLASGLVDGAVSGEVVVGGIERDDQCRLVEHLDDLDVLLVFGDEGVWRVDASQLTGRRIDRGLDPLVPVHELEAIPVGDVVGGPELADLLRLRGAALTGAFLVGIAQACTDQAVAYAAERRQFNRPIGSFQAVKHLLADNVVRTELARAAVYAAGVTVDDPEVGPVERAVTGAKLMAADAAIENAKTSVQVHGGMGYTWEVDAHLFFKRAYALEPLFGSRDECADRMASFVGPTP